MVKDNNNEQSTTEVGKEKRPRTCFFVTPIGSENSSDFKKMTAILNNVINPVISEFGYESVVASDIQKIGSIGDQVFEAIKDSSLVIANLTGLNPNVMYETAVAHSFAKPTIMIMERSDKENLPFDLLGDRAVFFDNTIEGTGKLIEDLSLKIEHMQENVQVDNPVIRVMKQAATLQSIDGDDSLQAQMYRILVDMQEKQTNNYIKEQSVSTRPTTKRKGRIMILFADPVPVDIMKKLCTEINESTNAVDNISCSISNKSIRMSAVIGGEKYEKKILAFIRNIIDNYNLENPYTIELIDRV